jgi:hypothetical protein
MSRSVQRAHLSRPRRSIPKPLGKGTLIEWHFLKRGDQGQNCPDPWQEQNICAFGWNHVEQTETIWEFGEHELQNSPATESDELKSQGLPTMLHGQERSKHHHPRHIVTNTTLLGCPTTCATALTGRPLQPCNVEPERQG